MNKTVLMIDDDTVIRNLMEMVLNKEFRFVTESSGLSAMRWLQNGNVPSLILLDVLMPYLDGPAFLRQLRRMPGFEDVPVILLTGLQQNSEQIGDSMQYANAIVQKPFSPSKLKLLIEELLAGDSVGC